MAMDPRVGTLVAGYRIESLIGRGGMSVVYLAHHEGLERKAALKLLAPELAENEAFRQRFVRESRIAAGLDHPNVIPVYDAGEAEGLLFIAMRYVRGSDLKTLLADHGPLDPSDVVRVVDQLGAALDAAHAEGLVHRDVKPANVLLSPATAPARVGHLYLADFGLTKKSLSGSGITRSGQFVGTIDYVAPEQIRSEPVDGRTDVYSLGCLLYECCTGEPPFVRDTEVAVMFAHLNDPPPSVTERAEGFPAGIDAVVSAAMAKEPDDRYRSAGDMASGTRRALLEPAPGQPIVPVRDEPRAPAAKPAPDRRRRRVVFGGAGVAAIAVVALVVALLAGGGAPSPTPSTSASTTPGSSPSVPASTGAGPLPAGFAGLARLDLRTGAVEHGYPLSLRRMPGAVNAIVPRPILAAEGSIWVDAGIGETEIARIDPDTGSVEDRRTLRRSGAQNEFLAAGEGSLWVLTFGGLAGPAADELFRIDTGNDRTLATIPLPSTSAGLAAGSREGVWVLEAAGTLLQIDPGTNRIAKTISGLPGGSGVAVAGGDVWVADNLAGAVYRVDPETRKWTTITLPGGADAIAADPNGVWVMDRASGLVLPIDPSTGAVGQQIRVGEDPSWIAVGGGSVWVTSPSEGAVWRIDPVSAVGTPIPVSGAPGPGAVSAGEGGVWATVD